MTPCPRCASPLLTEHPTCPHCGAAVSEVTTEVRPLPLLLLGLLLAGCGEEEDTGEDSGSQIQALYGVPATATVSEDAGGEE